MRRLSMLSMVALLSATCTATAAPPDRGDFKVVYETPDDPDLQEWDELFREAELLEEVLEVFNGMLVLPHDVAVVLGECGEANAFYIPDDKMVVMCYELVATFAEIFFENATTDEEVDLAAESIIGATLFILFHEIGHALVDIYDLPITGREEDAVDQLATVILVESGDETMESSALDGATFFAMSWEQVEEIEEDDFWDEHSLDSQRFYNIVCWVVGSDPEGWAHLVDDDEGLPAARAERCPDESGRLSSAWGSLLDPFLQPD